MMKANAVCRRCGRSNCLDVSFYNRDVCCKCRLTISALKFNYSQIKSPIDKAEPCQDCEDMMKDVKRLERLDLKGYRADVVSQNPKLRYDNIMENHTMALNIDYTVKGDVHPENYFFKTEVGILKTHIMCMWWTETTESIIICFVSITEHCMMDLELFNIKEFIENGNSNM